MLSAVASLWFGEVIGAATRTAQAYMEYMSPFRAVPFFEMIGATPWFEHDSENALLCLFHTCIAQKSGAHQSFKQTAKLGVEIFVPHPL